MRLVLTLVCVAVGDGKDDGPGSSADYHLPGSIGDGDPEPQRRGGGGRPCEFLILRTHNVQSIMGMKGLRNVGLCTVTPRGSTKPSRVLLLSSGKSSLFFGPLQRGAAALFCYI